MAAWAASGLPARIADTIAACCEVEWSMFRGSSGKVSSHAFTFARLSATSGTREGMPASSAIVR